MLRLPKVIFTNKFLLPALPPPGTFKDKKVLIIGASGGLGLATAVHYVNLGASLASDEKFMFNYQVQRKWRMREYFRHLSP